MRYINKSDISTSDKKTELLFNKDGLVSKSATETKFAKVIGKENKYTYYIRIHQGSPYDPLGPYGHRENYLETALKKVSRNTFDFYVMYLKTNNSIYLTRAQRGYLND